MTVWYAERNEFRSAYQTVICIEWQIRGTVFSSDDGHLVARNYVGKSNKHIKKICVPSWFYLQKDYLRFDCTDYLKISQN